MNLILKQGDLVTYHIETPTLNERGFILGHSYRVESDRDALVVRSNSYTINLVNTNGDLTDDSDHFKLDKSAIKLPQGNV